MTEHSLRELVEQYYDRIFRAARFMSGDTTAAEDLTQETFLAAGQSLSRFRGKSSPYTWLYGILLNKFRRWLRRRKTRTTMSLQAMSDGSAGREGSEVLEADVPLPEETASRREDAGRVRAAMDTLTPDHRGVIALRFMDGLSYQEIAEALDCPVGTVKSRIHYALLRIEDVLTDPMAAAGAPADPGT